ncbi:(2Fe-2S)-binding protein [Candidatus Poribacteria bacterium]|nr:(2Fe-2S)-binding protein [Candidatus Poribacteria bacterium]
MPEHTKRPDAPSHSEEPTSSQQGGVSRRTFLKGVGGATVAASILPVVRPNAGNAQEAIKGVSMGPVTLKVNGKTHTISRVESRTTLLDALRNHLELTGAKPICLRASCGGCTVLKDGAPVYSCSILAMDAQGSEITTVEGLADGDDLHPVQQAFVEHDALMCGFCTPGFIMSVTALLNENKNPTLDDVKRSLAGNICRCGTYTRIFEATMTAAERMREGA